jgi:hypothetical protein
VIAEIADRGTMLTLRFAVMAPIRPTNRDGPVGHSRSGRVVGEGRCGNAREHRMTLAHQGARDPQKLCNRAVKILRK